MLFGLLKVNAEMMQAILRTYLKGPTKLFFFTLFICSHTNVFVMNNADLMSPASLFCIHIPLSVLSQRFHSLTLIRIYSLEFVLFPVVHMWIWQEKNCQNTDLRNTKSFICNVFQTVAPADRKQIIAVAGIIPKKSVLRISKLQLLL